MTIGCLFADTVTELRCFFLLDEATLTFLPASRLNTYPKVWEAGTYLLNGKNRFFVNFSTDQDYYYPPQANDRLDTLTGNWALIIRSSYEGYPHWFPQFDASEAAFRIIFEEMGNGGEILSL